MNILSFDPPKASPQGASLFGVDGAKPAGKEGFTVSFEAALNTAAPGAAQTAKSSAVAGRLSEQAQVKGPFQTQNPKAGNSQQLPVRDMESRYSMAPDGDAQESSVTSGFSGAETSDQEPEQKELRQQGAEEIWWWNNRW